MIKLGKHIRTIFFLVGAILFILLLQKVGVREILDQLKSLSWRFVAILIVSAIWYVLYTFGWEQYFKPDNREISFFKLFKIKISGEALNTLTPLSFLGGDPARVYLLKKHYPLSEGAASVVVDRTLHSIAILFVVLTGSIFAFLKLDLPAHFRYGMPVVLSVSIIFMGFILMHQRKGIFTLLIGICQRLKIKKEFSEKTIDRIEKLDANISSFYHEKPRRFWIAISCHIIGRFLGVVEIYLIGHFVDSRFGWLAALFLCAIAPVINMIFTFIPGALGVLEGTYGVVLYFLGFNPAIGITIQIAKRARSLFWIVVGLIALGAGDRKTAMNSDNLLEQV